MFLRCHWFVNDFHREFLASLAYTYIADDDFIDVPIELMPDEKYLGKKDF